MRVCILKANGRLIEAQSGGDTEAHLETLRANARAAGYTDDQVDVRFMDDAGFAQLMDLRNYRSDGNGGVRPATAEEITAYDAAQEQATLEDGMGRPEIQAVLGVIAAGRDVDVATVQAEAIAARAAQVASVVKKAL